MCWQCDNPDLTQADYLRLLRSGVADHGWLVQGVESDHPHPPWAYTIGLSAFGLPELVATGLELRAAGDLLNGVAAHAVHAEPPEPGERIPLRGGPEIEIVPLTAPEVHLVFAVALYGPEIRALQLVHADERGRWPWSADFRDGRGGQPVLGVRCGG
jgi:hypothetical protein